MTDTPPTVPTYPAPPVLEQWKVFIGDLARPFAIISGSIAADIAIVAVAFRSKEPTLESAAIFVGALGLYVVGLYGAKALENAAASKHTAQVAIAQAATPVDNSAT